MAYQLQLRRGTAAENDAYTGALGEVTVDTTNNELRLHDGLTPGGHPIGAPGAGSGENNTASNVNTAGVGVFDAKVGVDLQFRGVAAASSRVSVGFDDPTNEIRLDVVEANVLLQNLGGAVTDGQIPASIARDSEVTAAVAAHEAAGDPHTGYQLESEKDAASGYAGLDANARVDDARLANMAANTVKGNPTGSVAAPQDIACTAAGRALLDDADAAAQRTTLGLGTAAVEDTVPISKGGTGQTARQAAIDALVDVAGATNEHVLTKDTATGNAVFKAVPGGGGGEANTASNQGSGVGIFDEKNGVDLEFRSLVGSSRLSIALDDPNDEIDIDVVEANLLLQNLGGAVTDGQIPASIARDSEVTAAVAAHEAAGDPHTGYQLESEKDAASGYAGLDANARVDDARLANMAANTVKGNPTGSVAAPQDIACTAAGRALLDDADAAAQRTTLGLGALATLAEVGTAQITDASVTNAKLSTNAKTTALQIVIGNGSDVITTGVKGYLQIPFHCTITAWHLVADQSGSIVIDVWKDTYANFPPTDADSIAGTELPTLSAAQKNQDLSLSSWTTDVNADEWLGFNVDSATTVTQVTLVLSLTRHDG